MPGRWISAGGEYQIPFFAAAAKLLEGGENSCPKCGHKFLRYYFHVFRNDTGKGTFWVWCPACRTTCHLPRVVPSLDVPRDPFAHCSTKEFAAMELDERESLLDRLDQLWDQGV